MIGGIGTLREKQYMLKGDTRELARFLGERRGNNHRQITVKELTVITAGCLQVVKECSRCYVVASNMVKDAERKLRLEASVLSRSPRDFRRRMRPSRSIPAAGSTRRFTSKTTRTGSSMTSSSSPRHLSGRLPTMRSNLLRFELSEVDA